MADDPREELTNWLRDAHAMEAATIDNLESLLKTLDDYPELKMRLSAHLEASRRQRDDIESALGRLGADTSTLKDWLMKMSGSSQPMFSKWTSDSVPKSCLAAYAYENFEIASYRSLMGAAQELGLPELRAMCERAIAEEEDIADFLFEHIPDVTRQYLQLRHGDRLGRSATAAESSRPAVPPPH